MSVEPDFVMLGVREPDGSCSIYASTELRRATMIAHREAPLGTILALGGDVKKIPPSRIELDAELGSYVEGHGASYAEALLDLMRTWQPPDGQRALVDEIAAIGAAPEPMVVQKAGSHLGLVIDGEIVEGPDVDETDYWYVVADWNGKVVYDGRGPVPHDLITLDARDVAEGRAFTFDVRRIEPAGPIDRPPGETP